MLTPLSIRSLQPLRATNTQVITIAELSNQIQVYNQEQFTGQLDLKLENTLDQQWSLYFNLGDLVWVTSKEHPVRRWCRQLAWHCPQLVAEQESNLSYVPCYDSLAKLVRQEKIQQEQLEAIIEGHILEILFDIVQWGERLCYRFGGQLTYRAIPVDTRDSKLLVIPTERVWRSTLKLWDAWQRAGLEECSPNMAPVIVKAEELQRQTSHLVYHNLVTLANGNHTFRDLAVKFNRNLLLLAQPIMPFISQGLMGLRKVEDMRRSVKTVTTTPPKSSHDTPSLGAVNYQPTQPLVACIDDSRTDSLRMNQILTESGYRCLNIQDPVQALPILLENKPDFIFLDLVMPIANGYELCAQIRRISVLKDTPVIILTSNDGIVDRLRAKVVGSSGFLAKPINSEKVQNIVQMHLQKSTQQAMSVQLKNGGETSLQTQLVNNRFPQLL